MSETDSSIAAFRCRIQSRRLTEETLEVLHSMLASRDVPVVLETRSKLRDLMRSEAVRALREVSAAGDKLRVVQFFVTAFALIADVESCLALKYDALILRESKTLQDNQMQVTCQEWLTFAKDSLDNGFYSIAEKGFGNALKCIQSGTGINAHSSEVGTSTKCSDVDDIKRLRELASSLASSHSVQTQSTQYMKRKAERVEENQNTLRLVKTKHVGSNHFRNGIKKRNAQMLLLSQSRPAATLPFPD